MDVTLYYEAALWPDLTAVCVFGQVLYGGRVWNSGVSTGGHEGERHHEQGSFTAGYERMT